MMSDRDQILLLLCVIFGAVWLYRAIRRGRGRAPRFAGKRIRSETIVVNRRNLIRYAVGARLIWLTVVFVCLIAILILLWQGGGMSGAALTASVVVVFAIMLPAVLPVWMVLSSIRSALTADRFADEFGGRCFDIDGDRLRCVTKEWFIFICDIDSFVLHAPEIDFTRAPLRSERTISTKGKVSVQLFNQGYRVFLKNGKTVFVSNAMIAQVRKWMASRSFH